MKTLPLTVAALVLLLCFVDAGLPTTLAQGHAQSSVRPEAKQAGEIPVVERLSALPDDAIFKKATRTRPVEINTAEQAAKHFSEAQLKVLNKSVDWDKQTVLIFAWRGSGQDKYTAEINKTPKKVLVTFLYAPGRTRDLRPHIYVYALKSGVPWRIR